VTGGIILGIEVVIALEEGLPLGEEGPGGEEVAAVLLQDPDPGPIGEGKPLGKGELEGDAGVALIEADVGVGMADDRSLRRRGQGRLGEQGEPASQKGGRETDAVRETSQRHEEDLLVHRQAATRK
jgi:hypothetical protein